MRKRWDAASKLVVFHDILVPLAHGVTTERAFALILEQCGYEPLWTEDEQGMTLRLRLRGSDELAPERFARDRSQGNHAVLRQRIMSSVCTKGLLGWRTLPRDQYTIEHSIAERTVHTVWDWPERRRRG
jgi:hypothetical protein